MLVLLGWRRAAVVSELYMLTIQSGVDKVGACTPASLSTPRRTQRLLSGT